MNILVVGRAFVRLLTVGAGVAAVFWAVSVIPTFWSENILANVSKSIIAGDGYKPEVLTAVELQINRRNLRAGLLGKFALLKGRIAETAIQDGNSSKADAQLKDMLSVLDEIFSNAPIDSFAWLAKFWTESTRNGLRPAYWRFLRMSYDEGPYEGWVSLKRDRILLGIYSFLPRDFSDLALFEFSQLVRWGLVNEAAALASGPGLGLRPVLYEKLKNLPDERRRRFARVMYQLNLDDIPIPGAPVPRQLYER